MLGVRQGLSCGAACGPRIVSRRRLLMPVAAALLGVSAVAAMAQQAEIFTGGRSQFGADLAVAGYDTVAYFTQNKPVKGSDSFTTSYEGATWKFASKEHLALFKADPTKYAPQYGGYCAYGVAQGYLVSIEPEQFSIIDGKLYLNYDAGVQKKWTKDPAGYNQTATAKFSDLLKK